MFVGDGLQLTGQMKTFVTDGFLVSQLLLIGQCIATDMYKDEKTFILSDCRRNCYKRIVAT